MRREFKLATIALAGAGLAISQLGRTLDWNTFGSDVGRTGAERTDPFINKDSVAKDFSLLYKAKLDEMPKGVRSVGPPVIISILISYRGFKELAFFGGSNNTVYSMNVDNGKMFWQKPMIYSSDQPQWKDPSLPCSADVIPSVSLVPTTPFGFGRGGRGAPAPASTPVPPGRGLGGGGFGASRPVLTLGSDGRLHRLNSANGDDQGGPPIRFIPPNARASALNISDNVVYTSTNQGCGAVPNAIWAMDFIPETPAVTSFETHGGGVWGTGGVAIGPDHTIYAQLGDGPLDPASHKWSNALLALAPRTLEVKHYFTPANLGNPKNIGMSAATPVVFTWKDKTIVAASGKDGRVYLLDGAQPGGADHNTSLARSAVLSDGANPDRGIYGLASWEDEAQNRWLAASVWGPVPGASNSNGSVVAFKIEEKDGGPALTQAWVSRDLSAPVPPVIAGGVVFALAAGDHTRTVKDGWKGVLSVEEKPKNNARATLYALNAETGKEIWSSKQQITAPGALTGLTAANGRVYLGTTDSTFWCFGIPMEH
jgi:outer membrane protein assembly factor BamB